MVNDEFDSSIDLAAERRCVARNRHGIASPHGDQQLRTDAPAEEGVAYSVRPLDTQLKVRLRVPTAIAVRFYPYGESGHANFLGNAIECFRRRRRDRRT